ncbi:MAG: hypothetical protein LAT57_09300 [Balneolales bacterium]|nr:hypothetical protein [Balneolales bacterium]
MKTFILLFVIGTLAISTSKTIRGAEASIEFGAQEHPCPPFNQEAYNRLVTFAKYSFPQSYEGITAQAIPPEEIQWLEFHPKCENIQDVDDGYIVSLFKSNQYYLEVFLFTDHVKEIDEETLELNLLPSYIVVFDENWVNVIGLFYF